MHGNLFQRDTIKSPIYCWWHLRITVYVREAITTTERTVTNFSHSLWNNDFNKR